MVTRSNIGTIINIATTKVCHTVTSIEQIWPQVACMYSVQVLWYRIWNLDLNTAR